MLDVVSPAGDLLPLTRSQLLIWTGQQLAPDDPLYNMVLTFRISGRLDTECFVSAFGALVDRCDALRIVFENRDDVPRQRFLPSIKYDLPVIDFSAEADPDQALDDWIDAHRVRRFALTEPLFETALLQVGDDDYIWYLNQHHLITDAWSVSVIYRKMRELYRAAADGDMASVDALPRYQDRVREEHERAPSKRREKADTYWRQRLATPVAASSFYRKPPADRAGRTERVEVPIGPERSRRLKELSGDDRFRAFTQDLALFQLFATILFSYLRRMTGTRELSIGTPSHGRPDARAKDAAGLFIEIFPLRVECDHDDTFQTLYKKIARRTQELLINAEPGISGFEHNRAFDVLLNFITASFGDFAGLPMRSEWIHADHGDRNHLLRMQVHDFDQADAFGVFLDLNTDAFVAEEKRWAKEHVLRLLDALLADPEQRIDAVPLVSAEERLWLTETQNETSTQELPTATVIDMFEAQAAATPGNVAVVCRDRSLTYGELEGQVRRLAALLVRRGAGTGVRVAIAMTRSIDAVIAILATLKSGAAYVPIDPGYPEERITWILADAVVPLLLTQEALRDRLPTDGVEVVAVDAWLASGEAEVADPIPVCAGLDDIAYLIYTSGSTGTPKGVVVEHRGLANYIDWCRRYYLRDAPLDFPLFSSLSFDLTVTSTFVPLVSGGRLIVYEEPESAQEITIRRVIEDNMVDAIKLTPAHLALIQSMDFSGSRLKTLIVGGEDFKTELAATVSRYFGDRIEIYNEYGPTEGTVACMIHRFDPARDTDGSVPIGRSIDNTQIYVLDHHLNPVPRGVVGEICIGGVGVAQGYLNQPERSAESFVPDPFRPGGRLYRTGDLARWNAAGDMEYLGRDDHQVKIRGMRIELGEIEATLLEHPGISECVVDAVVRHDADATNAAGAFCVECGLDVNHPSAQLNDAGVCRTCEVYRQERDAAGAYFRTMEDLRALVPEIKARATGEHDCLMLLSGGKDSTYALCQLVDLGLKPLVFTMDNGYISDGAKANIQRIVDQLGLELVTGETPAMNAIFADSLKRFSNVCEGCFKTIYTLSMNLAAERGIGFIVTGLSRGQVFETRVADLFHQRVFDSETIDQTIIEARKAYHRMDDAVSRNLDVEIFREDEIFDRVRFIDFYRYCDVKLDNVLDYLATRAAWIRPKDTGRSTNCLINEVGIFVHKKERGYHNYATPYSWDVRLGHKERDAARHELDDDIDIDNVNRILAEVGYTPVEPPARHGQDKYLIGWYVSASDIPAASLRERLRRRLPDEFVPRQFVRVESLPLTANGKVDRAMLPRPGLMRPDSAGEYVAPEGDVEATLAQLWSEILGVERIGANDSFFDLGGDSILNIQIVSRAKQQGLAITPQNIFEHPTIRGLAGVSGRQTAVVAEQAPVTGPVALTPIQRRFFTASRAYPAQYSQAVLLRSSTTLDADLLRAAWRELLTHHDVLRSRFSRGDGGWRQVITGPDTALLDVAREDLGSVETADLDDAIDAAAERLQRSLSLQDGRLIRVACFDCGHGRPTLMLAIIHHLVIDGVSWWVLLQDLETLYGQLARGAEPRLPAKTSSVRQWADALSRYAGSSSLQHSAEYWRACTGNAPMPVDFGDGCNDLGSAHTVSVALDAAETAHLLHDVPAALRVQVPDVLLAAIRRGCRWASGQTLRIDLEGHGREDIAPDIDLLRTVGWFTTIYPVDLAGSPDNDPVTDLKLVKERLRAVPRRGVDYGVLRYMYADPSVRTELERQPPAEVLFNYLGQWEQTLANSRQFEFARPIMGFFGSDGARDYLLEINAIVFGGALRIDLTYSRNLHEPGTIEDLASGILSELRILIDACLSTSDAGLTPSDFPSAGLSQLELDALLDDFADGA